MVLLFGLGMAVYQADQLNHDRFQESSRQTVAKDLNLIKSNLETLLIGNIQLVRGLASLISLNPDLTQQEFERATAPLLEGRSLFRNIAAAPDLVITLMYPIEGNEKAIGLDYRKTPSQFEASERARTTGKLVLAGPLQLVQGGTGIITRIPIFVHEETGDRWFWGIISAVIDVQTLYKESGLLSADDNLEVAIRGKDAKGPLGEVFFGRPQLYKEQPVLDDIPLPSGSWQIAALPKDGWKPVAENRWQFRATLLIIAAIIFLPFIALLISLEALHRARSATDTANRKLTSTLNAMDEVGFAIHWIELKTGKLIYFNDYAEIMLGYSEKELQELTIPQIDHNFPADEFHKIAAETRSKGKLRFETTHHHKNGHPIPVEVISYYRDADDNLPEHAITFTTDISERKYLENLLKQKTTQLETIFENAFIGIGIIQNRVFKLANPAMARIFGYELDEFINYPLDRVYPDKETYEKVGLEMYKIMNQGSLFEREMPMRYRDGSKIWIRISSRAINSESKSHEYLFIVENITERKQAETSLLEAKKEAESASEAKTKFLANMSHEIRTPITGVMGLSELLLEDEIPEQSREKVLRIKSASDSLLHVINEILDIGKLEAGKLEIEYLNCNLQQLIKDTLAIFKHSHNRSDEVRLSLSTAENFPDYAKTDPTRLRQVLINLIGNALKFTHEGSVSVHCEIIEEPASDKEFIRFTITDTGIGISPQNMQKLFNEFSQADTSISRNYEGTGLGLSISKRLVELMGGSIAVKSEEGMGSTFWFSIPYQKVAKDSLVESPESSAKDYHATRALNILLAEDNRVNQLIIKKYMQMYGHKVSIANNGAEAVSSVQNNQFDLILMDIRMPEMNGPEATKVIRENEDRQKSSIPIIAVTADAIKENVDSFIEAGMNRVVSKPIDRVELILTINEVLDEQVHVTS